MTMQIDPLLRALADTTRLRIMRLLSAMELAVGELAQVLGQSQPRVSRHIRILCDAGLTERRKEGSWVFLRSAIGEDRAPPLGAAAARLLAVAEGDDAAFAAQCAEDRRNLAAIRSARAASAEAWFARHAEEWDTLRVLHTPDGPVEAALGRARGEELSHAAGAGADIEQRAKIAAQRPFERSFDRPVGRMQHPQGVPLLGMAGKPGLGAGGAG